MELWLWRMIISMLCIYIIPLGERSKTEDSVLLSLHRNVFCGWNVLIDAIVIWVFDNSWYVVGNLISVRTAPFLSSNRVQNNVYVTLHILLDLVFSKLPNLIWQRFAEFPTRCTQTGEQTSIWVDRLINIPTNTPQHFCSLPLWPQRRSTLSAVDVHFHLPSFGCDMNNHITVYLQPCEAAQPSHSKDFV